MPTKTLPELAGEARGFFETFSRDSAPDVTLWRTNNPPEWVTALCLDAHSIYGDPPMMPDDHVYALIVSALDRIAEADDPDDAAHEWADGEVDIYNADRAAWLASHTDRASIVNDAVQDVGLGAGFRGNIFDVYEIIGLGQYEEARRVFGSVLSSLRARLAELDDDSDGEPSTDGEE